MGGGIVLTGLVEMRVSWPEYLSYKKKYLPLLELYARMGLGGV